MKVLVIRFSSIGDIVLTTPVLRCIKQQRPDVELHFATKASFRAVMGYNPYIDKFHYLENDDNELIASLKAENFDFIVDLHNNLRTLKIKKKLKVKSKAYQKLNIKKWLLVNLKLNLMPDKSIVERYLDAAKSLGIKNDGQGLDYFLPEHSTLKNSDLPMSHWAGYVGCVIGGSYNTKKLPADKWKELVSQVPYPVILMGGPEDRAEGDEIAASAPVKVYNACGKFSLNESAWMVKHAKVVVSNDTGLMHIAAAYKKPIISLWGNTSPEMGMFPYYGYNNINNVKAPMSVLMENKTLICHPCSKIGYEKCPKGHFKCMKELDMGLLAKNILKFWSEHPTKTT